MSEAKKCDRCGKLYTRYELKDNWWRYNVTKDCHPYGTVKIDLCKECKISLMKWLEVQDADCN